MMISVIPDKDGDCTANLTAGLRDATGGDITIDLAQAPYLSSSALRELIRFRREFAGRIELAGANALVNRTLQIVGFNKVFTIKTAA